MNARRSGLPLLFLFACSVDDRVLHLVKDAAAGRSEAHGGSDRAGASDGEAGAGDGNAQSGNGQGGEGALVDGCADLDTDGVADCTTTLVSNPSFTSDVEGWTPVGDAVLSWDPKNALDDLPSGSAKLSSRATIARATQCVPIEGRKLVIAYASVFVETTEEAEGAQALLEVAYFASDDCSGELEGFFETPPSSVASGWTTIHAGSVSTVTTSAVSIALVGVKARAATSQNAYFDNVMIEARDP